MANLRIVVVVEGGMVRSIMTDLPADQTPNVVVLDLDTQDEQLARVNREECDAYEAEVHAGTLREVG